jgi:hypothetical protein
VFVTVASLFLSASSLAGQSAATAIPRLTPAEMEAFLREATDDSIEKAVGDSLMQAERRAVLARRDRIVKIIEDRVAKFGEAAVLIDS